MTTPNGPILLNSSTGSDSNASGLGPASAVSGSGAELDGTSTVDVSYDGMDLSSISAGDLLYCSTSAGRQFSIIASVDTINETITTDDAWPTESGVSWAVGGKRATFDGTVQIFTDWYGGWIVETETDQTVAIDLRSNFVGGTANNNVEIRCNNKTITQTLNSFWTAVFAVPQHCTIKDAVLTTSLASGGLLLATLGNGSGGRLVENVHIDATLGGGGLTYCAYMGRDALFRNCSFKNGSYGVYAVWFNEFNNCLFDSNTNDGAYATHHAGFINCVFSNNGNHGLNARTGNRFYSVMSCITHNNGGDGFNILGIVDQLAQFINNIASENTGYGYNFPTAQSNPVIECVDYNNTSGRITGNYIDIDGITLTADPFTDAANDDFSLNSDAGGGAVLRAETMVMGSTTAYPFNWLTDGSGGGSPFHPLAQ